MISAVSIRTWKQAAGYEWKLQVRSWSTWLLALFFLGVVISEHPIFWDIDWELTLGDFAAAWADRSALIGSLVAILLIPFAINRTKRHQVADIELSKPVKNITYITSALIGAALPVFAICLMSMFIHAGITFFAGIDITIADLIWAYIYNAVLIALPPILFIIMGTFSASVFIHQPIIIVPIFLIYLILTTTTQAVADMQFAWFSPVVRPEYFDGPIPESWIPETIIHQIIYLVIGFSAVLIATARFQRQRFLAHSPIRMPKWSFPTSKLVIFDTFVPRLRFLWGGHIIAALLFAFAAYLNTISFPDSMVFLRVDYALFGLEFYLSLSGLLLLAGAVTRDASTGTLDLTLTKPINRWRLLAQRIIPAYALYLLTSILVISALHLTFESLPLRKAFAVAAITGLQLGAIGLTVANITRSSFAGYGAGIVFWLFEAAFKGRFTAPLYLLIVSTQVDQSAGEIWLNPNIWIPVKIASLLFVIWLLILNGWLLDAGKRKQIALIFICVTIPAWYFLSWWLVPLTLH